MRRNLYSLWVLLFCSSLIFCLTQTAKAQSEKATPYVKELNNIIIGFNLDTLNFKSSFLIDDGTVDDKLVIGLGEATHGTREFALLRNQLLKELILEKKLKLIAYESDYCNSLILNNYLLSDEKDSLDYYVTKHGLYGIYRTQEMYDLVKWIKSYNLTKLTVDKVQFLGIDMQDPYAMARKISSLFPQFKSLDQTSFNKFEAFKKIAYENKQKLTSTDEKKAQKELVDNIKDLVLKNAHQLDTLELVHCLKLLSQSLTLYDYPGFFTKAGDRYSTLRDKYMAENVQWILINKAKGQKIGLIAHNGHIAKTKLENSYRMGYHLRNALGDKYYSLGMSFDEGLVRIFDFEGTRKYKSFYYPSSTFDRSYEFIFKNCNPESFFLDINLASKNNFLNLFFEQFPYSKVIGATYQPNPKKDYYKQPLKECFDGLIFFRSTKAANQIKI